jgi:hypothetical protein
LIESYNILEDRLAENFAGLRANSYRCIAAGKPPGSLVRLPSQIRPYKDETKQILFNKTLYRVYKKRRPLEIKHIVNI